MLQNQKQLFDIPEDINYLNIASQSPSFKAVEQAGISAMEIYRIEERLFMIMDTEDHFSLEEKAFHDAQNPFVQKWESLMWEYQVALPTAKPNEKWVLMRPIFHWKA